VVTDAIGIAGEFTLSAVGERPLPGNHLHNFGEWSFGAYAEARKNATVALRRPYRPPNGQQL
jgi:hypothetical protein